MAWGYDDYPKYVPVAERRAKARRKMEKLRKEGRTIQPVEIDGRTIARSFWGKAWCKHLESFSDYSNRLPRGRTYVRNGSVCHLAVKPGCVEAVVSGSSLYNINIRIKKLGPDNWRAIKRRCAGQVGSMLELLQGKLSEQVMTVVTDREGGLFPLPGQIELDCSCPDWATMCKHVAAVLYGVGHRLDEQPELLFTLRDVDPQELIASELALPATTNGDVQTVADDRLSDIFGIDLETPQDGSSEVIPEVIPVHRRSGAVGVSPNPSRSPQRKAKKRTAASKAKATSKPQASPSSRGRRSAATKRTSTMRPTGQSIARLRRQAGLSAAAFARVLKVSAATVYRWESATGRLSLQSRSLDALATLKQSTRRK